MLNRKNFDLRVSNKSNNLSGKFLIASPFVQSDEIFNKSLIYVTDHNADGAVGLIVNNNIYVNKKLNKTLSKLFFNDASLANAKLEIFLGGPLDTEKGFIIHSNDYSKDLLIKCNDEISISSSTTTLKNILKGAGPKRSLLIMGYSGWKANQLEEEIEQNLWIVADSDTDIIFNPNHNTKWENALKKIGIDQSMFCCQVGHG
jgi:putative transcriptional regulator